MVPIIWHLVSGIWYPNDKFLKHQRILRDPDCILPQFRFSEIDVFITEGKNGGWLDADQRGGFRYFIF